MRISRFPGKPKKINKGDQVSGEEKGDCVWGVGAGGFVHACAQTRVVGDQILGEDSESFEPEDKTTNEKM